MSFGIIPKSEKQGNYGKKKPNTKKDLLAAFEESEAKKKRHDGPLDINKAVDKVVNYSVGVPMSINLFAVSRDFFT